MNRVRVFSIATKLRAGRSAVQILEETKIFFSSQTVQTALGRGVLCLGYSGQGVLFTTHAPYCDEVKNEWNYIATPPFMPPCRAPFKHLAT